jgi:hypothetical protein
MLTSRFVALLFLGPMAAFIANSEWGAALVLDMFRTQSVREEIKQELELRDNLELTNREIHRRIGIKESLVAALIAGRTTLAAVTEQFLVLNQLRPEYMMVIRLTWPGNTDEEKTAHNVIAYVSSGLHTYPVEQQAEVSARLNAELACLTTSATATN